MRFPHDDTLGLQTPFALPSPRTSSGVYGAVRALLLSADTAVILNLFQDPGAVTYQTDTLRGSADRAWMLKQVQHDGRGWEATA
jgi:hypothetical protein